MSQIDPSVFSTSSSWSSDSCQPAGADDVNGPTVSTGTRKVRRMRSAPHQRHEVVVRAVRQQDLFRKAGHSQTRMSRMAFLFRPPQPPYRLIYPPGSYRYESRMVPAVAHGEVSKARQPSCEMMPHTLHCACRASAPVDQATLRSARTKAAWLIRGPGCTLTEVAEACQPHCSQSPDSSVGFSG